MNDFPDEVVLAIKHHNKARQHVQEVLQIYILQQAQRDLPELIALQLSPHEHEDGFDFMPTGVQVKGGEMQLLPDAVEELWESEERDEFKTLIWALSDYVNERKPLILSLEA